MHGYLADPFHLSGLCRLRSQAAQRFVWTADTQTLVDSSSAPASRSPHHSHLHLCSDRLPLLSDQGVVPPNEVCGTVRPLDTWEGGRKTDKKIKNAIFACFKSCPISLLLGKEKKSRLLSCLALLFASLGIPSPWCTQGLAAGALAQAPPAFSLHFTAHSSHSSVRPGSPRAQVS